MGYIPVMNAADTVGATINKDGWYPLRRANEGGLDDGQLSRFMRAERGLNTESLQRLCQVLGVEVRLVKAKKGAR